MTDLYSGLLGKLAFDVDMRAAGHSQPEADELWRARFPPEPDNVIQVDFTKRERVSE